MKRSQKDTHRLVAMHFGKHCPRTKANERTAVRPRSEEQLDTREPSRLQSSLYRIFRSKVREDREEAKGKDKDKGKSETGVRNVHNGEPEIRADIPRGASSATKRSEILPSRQMPQKETTKKDGTKEEDKRNNRWH